MLTIPAQDSKPRNVKTMFTKQKNNNQSNKKEKTTAQTAGLETNLKVGINSRIMLKKNLNNYRKSAIVDSKKIVFCHSLHYTSSDQ